MKIFGIALSICGALLILLSLNMTVIVEKTYNTGLLADRSLWAMIGCTILICGFLLISSRGSNNDSTSENKLMKFMNGEPLLQRDKEKE